MEYTVTWRIEVSADSPQVAAYEARKIMLDKESEAVHFEVEPFGHPDKSVGVNLEELLHIMQEYPH